MFFGIGLTVGFLLGCAAKNKIDDTALRIAKLWKWSKKEDKDRETFHHSV